MKPRLKNIAVFIQSDPRASHRACEGIRIALGLASSGHTVSVLLSGQGALVLSRDTDDFVDEDHLNKFLAVLNGFIPAFYLDETRVTKNTDLRIDYRTVWISKKVLASKITEAEVFFSF
ncbi:MAG: hypothetical protein ACE5F7_08200 [Nitrospiria bacterium]